MTTQQQNIQITGVGLSCAYGNQPFAMFAAVATNMIFSKVHPFLHAPSVNDDSFERKITYPIDHLNNCNDQNDRILLNSIIALENAIESAEMNSDKETISNKKCLIYLMTPEPNDASDDELDFDEWYDIFTDEDSLLANYVDLNSIEIKFEQYSDATRKHFSHFCNKLSSGEWDIIIVGGFNSLLNDLTHYINAHEHYVKSIDGAENISDRDGAAFIIFEHNNIYLNSKNLKQNNLACA